MFENKNFANRRFNTPEECKNEKFKWKELSDKLNKLEGAHKTPQKWQKCWLDHKRDVWKKFNDAKVRQNHRPLKLYEKKVLDIIRPHRLRSGEHKKKSETDTVRDKIVSKYTFLEF